jgi:hypothetical protein
MKLLLRYTSMANNPQSVRSICLVEYQDLAWCGQSREHELVVILPTRNKKLYMRGEAGLFIETVQASVIWCCDTFPCAQSCIIIVVNESVVKMEMENCELRFRKGSQLQISVVALVIDGRTRHD